MKTLHIINKSFSHQSVWEPCLSSLREGDTLLLIENATTLALSQNDQGSVFSKIPNGVMVRFLLPDVQARGLESYLDEHQSVSDIRFVELCSQHDNNISWF